MYARKTVLDTKLVLNAVVGPRKFHLNISVEVTPQYLGINNDHSAISWQSQRAGDIGISGSEPTHCRNGRPTSQVQSFDKLSSVELCPAALSHVTVGFGWST